MSGQGNIFLIGMMGSGKTSAGKILAKLMRCNFVDMDALIEKDSGKKIKDLFSSNGEDYFRVLESEKLKDICQQSDQIISTGGGVILQKNNVQLMQKSGSVIYLKASLSNLIKRLKGGSNRPLLHGEDWEKNLAVLLANRASLYETAASFEITTDDKTSKAVAQEIMEKLKSS